MGDEGEQEVPICFGVGERFADRVRDGALRRDPAGGEGAGQGTRGGRAARGSGGGREEDAAAAAILEEAQPREPVDDGGSGGGVAAAPGGLGQCREKDVCDARGGPGGIAALCEREEARDGLGDDVLRRKREEEVELEFFPPPVTARVDRDSIDLHSFLSHLPAARSHLAPVAQAHIDDGIERARCLGRRGRRWRSRQVGRGIEGSGSGQATKLRMRRQGAGLFPLEPRQRRTHGKRNLLGWCH